MVDADRCISCGAIIPEGRLVCPVCQKRVEGMYIPDELPEETQIRIGRYYGYAYPYIPYNVSEWLVDNGFFSAPASTHYHGAYDGGLFDHSFQVAWELNALTRNNKLRWQDPRSPYIIGILHDLCKIDQYRKLDEPDEKGRLYAWNDTPIKGHGEKSVTLLSRLMDLTQEEAVCIRWHMGAFDEKENWSGYTEAVHNFPNVLWTHQADMIASHIKGI